MRRTLCLLAVAASLAVTSTASAQPAPNPEALRHFQEGKRLLDEQGCGPAIPEFELSLKSDESIGARYNLGKCYEKTNKKLALFNYQRAEEIAEKRNDDRLREIRAQRADFLARTPHIRFALPQPLPPDLHVTVDGNLIPSEDLQGETIYFLPPGDKDKKTYDVRVSAPSYDDLKLAVDQSTVQKNMLVTVTLKKTSDGTVTQPGRVATETRWGPFQYLGLGLIALGAAGVTYGLASFISYRTDESSLHNKFNDAEIAARGCPTNPPPAPDSTCGKNITTREDLRTQYNANEQEASDGGILWLSIGIGGVLAIAGGIALIVAGPRTEVPVDPGATAKAAPPLLRFVPTFTTREQGLSVVGTF